MQSAQECDKVEGGAGGGGTRPASRECACVLARAPNYSNAAHMMECYQASVGVSGY